MSVHDKLFDHAFRRWETRQAPAPAEPVARTTGTLPGAAGLLAATAEAMHPSARQPLGGGHQRRGGAFRRVAVVVRTSY